LLQALLPASALPQEAVDDIVARSAGSPTYIGETARWLVAMGVVVEREGASPLADVSRMRELPDALPMLLLRRAELAAGPEKRVLHATAVAARACEPGLLRALFCQDVHVHPALPSLSARGLIELTSHGDYRFRQSLLRELVYDSISPRNREDLHGRIGQVIESVMPEVAVQQPELLANHFAESTHVGRAIDYAMRSGERAVGGERAELPLAKAYLARSDERPAEALAVGRTAVKEALAANDRGLALAAEEAVAVFAADAGSQDESLRATERCVEHATAIGDL